MRLNADSRIRPERRRSIRVVEVVKLRGLRQAEREDVIGRQSSELLNYMAVELAEEAYPCLS